VNARGGLSDAKSSSPPDNPEAALWTAFRESKSPSVREELFSLHYPFARQIARRHFRDRKAGDIELPDLCQLASAGLLEAIDRFDPELGVPFRGYASRRISGSVLDGIAKASEFREQISFRNRVRAERVRSLTRLDADTLPAAEALEELINLAVGLALGFMLEGTGLVIDEQEAREPAASAYDSLVWKDTIRRVMNEVATLPKREQTIIRRHYLTGLDFEQIGTLLGVSKGRVSQLHRAALGLLKKRLRDACDFRLER